MSTGTGFPNVPEIIMDTSVIGITTTVKNNRSVAANITVNKASANNLGVVKPDGTTTTVDSNGVISCTVSVDKATASSLGTVKPDGETIIIDTNGVISVNPENISAATIALEDGTSIQDSIAAIQQIIADEETMMETEY